MVKIYSEDLKNRKIIELLGLIEKEKPQKANAIVWLQGDRYDRSKKVLSLFKKGMASKIIISGNDELVGVNKRETENNILLNKMVEWLKKRGVKDCQIIVENRSLNTKDQAKNVLRLAQNRRWKKIILVASPYHQIRVFLTFLKRAKKIKWEGVLINQPTKINWEKVPSGRKKRTKELFLEEIEKIKKYQNDITSVREGLSYFKNKVC